MVSLRTLAVSAIAFASTLVSAELTPQQIVSNINALTEKSMKLQAPAQSISIINGPLIIIGQGPFPPIIAGFTNIVETATTAIAQMQGTQPIKGEGDATAVARAFREFVRVHQALLNILIGKAGLFTTVPFIGQPVAAVLRQIESVVDTIAFSLIDLVEPRNQNSDIQSDANSLSGTIQVSIGAYEGLSVPDVRDKKFKREFIA